MATERVCDRCGERSADARGWKALFVGYRVPSPPTYPYNRVVDDDLGDLCAACVVQVKRFMREITPSTQPPPQPT